MQQPQIDNVALKDNKTLWEMGITLIFPMDYIVDGFPCIFHMVDVWIYDGHPSCSKVGPCKCPW
jgi:hypothetical protein